MSDDTCWKLLNVGPRPEEEPGGTPWKDDRPLGERILGRVKKVAELSGRLARPSGAASQKKPHSRLRRLSAELQNVGETSGKLQPFRTFFRKILHFGKIPKKI